MHTWMWFPLLPPSQLLCVMTNKLPLLVWSQHFPIFFSILYFVPFSLPFFSSGDGVPCFFSSSAFLLLPLCM
uniref:Uncharacterized protein n=1 Tax=Lutzomyia longipalpis TaxID=7200 RepID=A0A7G3B351_LUTLO